MFGEEGEYKAVAISSPRVIGMASGVALLYGGEGGHSKSRLRAPTEGACPLVSPHAGECLPRDPPRSNPTASARDGNPTGTFSQSHTALFGGGEGGIRTHGPFQDNGFRDRPIRPLSHLSAQGQTKTCSLPWTPVRFK